MSIFKNTSNEIKVIDNKIYLEADTNSDCVIVSLGEPINFSKFVSVFRNRIYFQSVKTGGNISDIPKETQWLLYSDDNAIYTIIIPLVCEPFRASLMGNGNEILIRCETGDEATRAKSGLVGYVIQGQNPYEMMEAAAKEISKLLPDTRTKSEKPIPDFVNYFGWCTWDSFYDKVCANDIKEGLESFKSGGIVPGLLILDDGWQTVEEVTSERGHHQLSSFSANEKFNHDLTPTVNLAKNEYGVKMFMVWHAIMGYWAGTYSKSPEMQRFNVKNKLQEYSEMMVEINPSFAKPRQNYPYGFIDPQYAYDFYNAYHSSLRHQGVDGVKIDVQASLEGLGKGEGGRIDVTKKVRKGLEASVNLNFNGNLINCMSCSNDHILNTLSTNVMRSSGDFYPNAPKSHSAHIFDNAFCSVYMGEFILCDWDMFQTKHEYGAYHAASRAISGSPIYVSDKVDEHDFDVINKLTLPDSRLPLCTRNARPTLDCLFINSDIKEDILKIFNYNNHTSGVIGAFNLSHENPHTKDISPKDIHGIYDGDYAVYSHNGATLLKAHFDDTITCSLDGHGFELYTVSKITNGFAPIGLSNKYNSGGTITAYERFKNNIYVCVEDGGTFVAYIDKCPKEVLVNNEATDFEYSNNTLTINLSKRCKNKIVITVG